MINFFRQNPTFFEFFSLQNDQILDPCQTLSKITFFAGKRCGGVRLCPKGLIFTKIFALALTVLEIFAKNHFQKIDIFRKIFQNFSFFPCSLSKIFEKFWFKYFSIFSKNFQFFLKFFKIFPKFAKKPQHFHKNFRFLKKKGIAFGDGWRWWGDGGGPWGLVSKGRGYDFDVCARLEISTTTPSSIFSKFFPKISKSVDFTGVFYCLK